MTISARFKNFGVKAHPLLMSPSMDYPFADRLIRMPSRSPAAKRGTYRALRTAMSSSQPRKVEHAGLGRLANGDVLVYIHKEEALEDAPAAAHYVWWMTSCGYWMRSRLVMHGAATPGCAWRAKVLSALPPAHRN